MSPSAPRRTGWPNGPAFPPRDDPTWGACKRRSETGWVVSTASHIGFRIGGGAAAGGHWDQGPIVRLHSEELAISEMTVRTHVSHIFEKLGVHTRMEAALHSLRLDTAGPPGA
ncbi:MAG TPA: LuxR C-terminal-related transcriptional regulator [Thermoanaerobaculia bacterium]